MMAAPAPPAGGRPRRLCSLVDDGANGYVYSGETLLEQVSGSTARQLLGDALGSVRGSSDEMGMLTGSADYDVFGAVRGTSTTGSAFGFTGEWTDAETGYLFLRARYYSPGAGRFTSVDTVIPNAPGSQGYHGYAYAANNPTTWTDPSGHLLAGSASISMVMTAMWAKLAVGIWVQIGALAATNVLLICALVVECGDVLSWAAAAIEGAFDSPNPIVKRLTEAIYRAMPIALFATLVAIGVKVTTALLECVRSGKCSPKRDESACDRIGRWGPAQRGGSKEGAQSWVYQLHVMTLLGVGLPNRTPAQGFYVHGSRVEFDGCSNGVLFDAKGCGLYGLWNRGKGVVKRDDQLKRQSGAAGAVGAPVTWLLAERRAVGLAAQGIVNTGTYNITPQLFPAMPPCTAVWDS